MSNYRSKCESTSTRGLPPFRVEVLFWDDVTGDISERPELVAKWWGSFLMLGTRPVAPYDELERWKTELRKRYALVPMTVVACSGDIQRVLCWDVIGSECIPNEDTVQDLAAELNQYLMDATDTGALSIPSERRGFAKEAYAFVDALNREECSVSVGVHKSVLRIQDDQAKPFPVTTLYVLVTSKEDAKTHVLVDLKTRFLT